MPLSRYELSAHGGNQMSALAKDSCDELWVAHPPQYGGPVSQQHSPGGEQAHGSGMVLETRDIRDRLALNVPGRARCGGRTKAHAEVAGKRKATHGHMLVKISESVDCRDHKAGTSSRLSGCPGRDASD